MDEHLSRVFLYFCLDFQLELIFSALCCCMLHLHTSSFGNDLINPEHLVTLNASAIIPTTLDYKLVWDVFFGVLCILHLFSVEHFIRCCTLCALTLTTTTATTSKAQPSSQPAIHAVRDECTNGDWMEKSWNGVVSGEKKRKRLKTFLTMSLIGDKLKYTEKNNAEEMKMR